MERISIIKNFFDLVGLTKTERISLIQSLMKEWNLPLADITKSATSPVGIAEDFGIDSEPPTKQKTAEPVVINFSEEDTVQANNLKEQVFSEVPTEPTPTVKRRGRRKKSDTDETSATDTVPTVKRRGRRKKNENGDIPETTATKLTAKRERKKKADTINETPIDSVKSPKKSRGRRKKAETFFSDIVDTDIVPENPENKETPPENISAEDEELIAETAGITDLRMLLEDEPPVRSKTTRKRNPAFRYLTDYSALKKLKIGQDYHPFEFLYQWEGYSLLSPYVLSDLMPIGIYIPYKSLVFGKYHGFIISIYDEQVIENLAEALDDAKNRMPKIDNEEWSVMNAIQFSIVKTSSEILNRMLTKIGGDRLNQTYRLLSPKSNYVTGIGKFRYAIDVK